MIHKQGEFRREPTSKLAALSMKELDALINKLRTDPSAEFMEEMREAWIEGDTATHWFDQGMADGLFRELCRSQIFYRFKEELKDYPPFFFGEERVPGSLEAFETSVPRDKRHHPSPEKIELRRALAELWAKHPDERTPVERSMTSRAYFILFA